LYQNTDLKLGMTFSILLSVSFLAASNCLDVQVLEKTDHLKLFHPSKKMNCDKNTNLD